MAAAARRKERTRLSRGEAWVSFLRGYGPVNRVDGMYAETIRDLADAYGVDPLRFEHPVLDELMGTFGAASGSMSNVVLTGTAGDGKTTLCNDLWASLGGDDRRASGENRDDHLELEVERHGRTVRVHFIFEFSGFAPPAGEAWPQGKLDLLERFAASMRDDTGEYFVLAVNDGKLVQAWDSLPDAHPAKAFGAVFEELLATGTRDLAGVRLKFLNLSRMRTADLLDRALKALLDREEWDCFEDEGSDPAFSRSSPLWRNHGVLGDPTFQKRLLELADLCDANGLHVSIREVLMLLVNALLGNADVREHVMRVDDLRASAISERGWEASIYRNLFGFNLPANRRGQFAVFGHLGSFRVGQETTNLLDTLIVFGEGHDALAEDHRLLLGDDPVFGATEGFARLRSAYVNGDDDRQDVAEFLAALADERRRLFFRLPEGDQRYDPWRLTMFQTAQRYRSAVLTPLRAERPIEPSVIRSLVCGLNRIWTGMLVAECDTLYLSTGLDYSSAPISDVLLLELSLRRGWAGGGVQIVSPDGMLPVLRVTLRPDREGIDYPLHLFRFEFLMRVADGALPASFSKECNEDVMAFKSRLLTEYHALAQESPANELTLIHPGPGNVLQPKSLNLPL
ncbi:hypothetical protein [Sphingomonas panni]|uniref:hypothetical protein n=1 Tax=Sphingomonas panni TaxID=237612 RepID=UPI001F5B3EE1|nr:hypothetical protein [Sphingomonas panni]